MIGRQIIADAISRRVIGVMPVQFRFLDRNPAFVVPLQLERNKTILGLTRPRR